MDASASSAGAAFSRERRQNLSVRVWLKVSPPGAQNRTKPPRKPATNVLAPSLRRETQVAGKNRRTGR
jgi:hypothetical protein